MKNWFTLAYLLLAAQLVLVGLTTVTIELIGVFGTKRKMDTISEHWWFFQDRHPTAAALILVAYALFNIWLVIHFAWGDKT